MELSAGGALVFEFGFLREVQKVYCTGEITPGGILSLLTCSKDLEGTILGSFQEGGDTILVVSTNGGPHHTPILKQPSYTLWVKYPIAIEYKGVWEYGFLDCSRALALLLYLTQKVPVRVEAQAGTIALIVGGEPKPMSNRFVWSSTASFVRRVVDLSMRRRYLEKELELVPDSEYAREGISEINRDLEILEKSFSNNKEVDFSLYNVVVEKESPTHIIIRWYPTFSWGVGRFTEEVPYSRILAPPVTLIVRRDDPKYLIVGGVLHAECLGDFAPLANEAVFRRDLGALVELITEWRYTFGPDYAVHPETGVLKAFQWLSSLEESQIEVEIDGHLETIPLGAFGRL